MGPDSHARIKKKKKKKKRKKNNNNYQNKQKISFDYIF